MTLAAYYGANGWLLDFDGTASWSTPGCGAA